MNNLSFYIAVFMRRFHYFLLVFILTAAAAITMAVVLPPVYVSETQLLVESSSIPDELAAPTVQTGAIEELQIIEQRLMTRGNLLSVARSLDVFEEIDTMSVDDIVEAMRDGTQIDLTAGRGLATIMGLGFASDNGEKSARVVNQYVTLILDGSLASRVGRASETLKFFEDQVDRLGKELAIQSGIILDFQNENTGALPDTLSFRLTQQTVFQERLGSVERQIASLAEQRRRLVEIFNATGQVDAGTLTPEQQRLATLQDDLRRALAVYSTENPKVKLIQAQIAQQEAVVIGQEGAVVSGNRPAPMTVLDINLADIDARVDLLVEQKQQIVVQLNVLVTSIEKTAGNAIRLDAYNRDYTNTQQQYNTAVDSLSKAATGERIELLSKGQTIVVLDPPTAPQTPTSPNRKLIAAAGVLLGGMLGFAFVFLLEFLNNSIRRPSDIINQMGITPIATVPYIRTPMELVLRRATIIGIFAFVIVGVPAALFAVHQYYMPLDLIYERIAEKLGDSI